MLDEYDEKIRAELAKLRAKLIEEGRPLVGDVVLWTNGIKRRISHDWNDSYQTSFLHAGSFFTTGSGHGNFSGGLQPSVLAEFLVKTDEIEDAQFWFFSHNEAGAGRGVRCNLPCRVWRLELFARSREEAVKHPKAIQAKKFWGDNHREYEAVVKSIMHPAVLSNPDYF